MNTIKVEVNIDINDESQFNTLNNFLAELRSAGGESVTVTGKAKEVIKPAKVVAAVAEQVSEKAAPKLESTGAPKLDAIRDLIAEKVQDNRIAIVNKLSELGAASASELPIDKYVEFHDFLSAL